MPPGDARDAFDRGVVVLADVVVVLAADALFTVDRLGEVVERARVGARPVEAELRVGSASSRPGISLQLEIFESGSQTLLSWSTVRQVTGFSVLIIDRQRVVGDLDVLVGDAVLLAGVDLFGLDRRARRR